MTKKAEEKEFYTDEAIYKTKADILITFGKRSSGKSYAQKKRMIDDFAKNGDQFYYLRRRAEEIRPVLVNSYFSDMFTYLNEVFKGRFEGIEWYDVEAKAGEFYLVGYSEDSTKKQKFGIIGYYGCLVRSEYVKTASYPKVTTLVFEEFLSRDSEISEEFERLQSIISTVGRDREGFKVRLIGNTVSQNSQILRAMNIDPRKLNQGEITLYSYFGDDGAETRVAVEWTDSTTGLATSRFANFGHQKEAMINNGEWETDAYALYTEFPEQDITDQFVLTDGTIKIYLYVDWNNRIGYVSNKREDTVGEYIVFTTEETILNRNTYNFMCDYPAVVNVKKNIKSLILNNQLRFNKFLTGDDFFYIIKGNI